MPTSFIRSTIDRFQSSFSGFFAANPLRIAAISTGCGGAAGAVAVAADCTAGAAGVPAPGCAADGLPLKGVALATWPKVSDIRLLSKPITLPFYALLVYCDN